MANNEEMVQAKQQIRRLEKSCLFYLEQLQKRLIGATVVTSRNHIHEFTDTVIRRGELVYITDVSNRGYDIQTVDGRKLMEIGWDI